MKKNTVRGLMAAGLVCVLLGAALVALTKSLLWLCLFVLGLTLAAAGGVGAAQGARLRCPACGCALNPRTPPDSGLPAGTARCPRCGSIFSRS